jgi:hypothetical protein
MEDKSMNKKAAPKTARAKSKPSMTADDHRKLAAKHHLKSRMHELKADTLDVDAPPSSKGGKGKITIRPY